MASPQRAIGTPLVAMGMVAVFVVAAVGIVIAMNQGGPGGPNNSTFSELSASRTSGPWNFTAIVNSSSVAQGRFVGLDVILENVGTTNQTIRNFVGPYINPEVYAPNGTEVWVWDPPQSTWPTWTFPSGHAFPQSVSIPTTQLCGGQTYTIKVAPLSEDVPAQDNLTIVLQFFVH